MKANFSQWWSRVSSFNIEDLFSRKREPGPPRTVFINENLPTEYLDPKGRVLPRYIYGSNQIISSKYTLITFIPRNLLEQFRRIANIFFLILAILQFFQIFATISPGVAILPLIIIIVVTALKDGYEDFRRHQADREVNYSMSKVLSGGNWVNPNMMHGKSKTFVKGLVPKNRKPPLLAANVDPHAAGDASLPEDIEAMSDENVEFDYAKPKPDGPHWKRLKWEDLKVGDFVKIMEDEPFPADILICSTSDEDDVAFVETKNLDGETNLKSRNAVPALTYLNTAAACTSTDPFRINCDRPENNLYRIHAAVDADGEQFPVDLQTIFLRGSVLRNTKWAIGVIMFTGEDTKIVMNAGGAPSKRSRVERQMNPQVLINLAIMVVLSIVCAIADSQLEKHYYPLNAPWLFDDNRSDDNPSINGIITFIYAILTFQNVVPISLYISIEVVRTLQSVWIYFDREMFYEKTKQATVARSWNLSDDLGQIEYIFSDKTGTLTQNLMVFRQCSVGGKAYRGDEGADSDETAVIEKADDKQITSTPSIASTSASSSVRSLQDVPRFQDSSLSADIAALKSNPDWANTTLHGFFSVLSLCHTALASADPNTGKIVYKAQSPDESALVQAAADIGYVFLGKDKQTLSLRTPMSQEPEQYELLNILDFTSARKRMSVLLRPLNGDDDRVFLLTKGADNVIFERLAEGNDSLKATTETHLSEFASEGLRTLTLGYKTISADDYEHWNARYHEASVALDDRESKVERVSAEIEGGLTLLGATAIEDKLQDGVPETIADLKRAGIKIWVATGDKLETAIAIGRSTNLVSHENNIIVVRGGNRPVDQQINNAINQFFPESVGTDVASLQRLTSQTSHGQPIYRTNTGMSSIVGEANGERPGGFILVVDGAALTQIFDSEEHKSLLLRLAMLCEGVIACRVSPLQKAFLVRLVKNGLKAMTLAIGDGANDVSMIQAADIGVGISGEEGLQAVNSSDYAIAQFRFLKKLLLVHGHWSFARNGIMILNFFYKNIVPTGVLFWFQIYCGWSAPFAFDYLYILFWNSVWSIAPVIGIGLFDRILDARDLMDMPELYHYGKEGYWFKNKDFLIYMFDALYQSTIIFFLAAYGYQSVSARSDGYAVSQYEWTTTAAIAGVMIADIYTGLCASAWTWWLVFAVYLGIVIVWAFTLIYSAVTPTESSWFIYGSYYYLCTAAYFWLLIPIVFCLAMAPRYLAKAYKFIVSPGDLEIIRYIRSMDPYASLKDIAQGHMGIGMSVIPSRTRSDRRKSRASYRSARHLIDPRLASRTDMSTGMVSVDHGFDFATEEDGVAMRRIQSNLSDIRMESNPRLAGGSSKARTRFSLRKSIRNKLSTKRRPPIKEE